MLPSLPNLDELINLKPEGVAQAINAIQPAFQTIYQNVLFKSEEARIAALAHLLSSEYRYSRGLSLPHVQRSLQDLYGFAVSTTGSNSSLFDSIIGQFGNNITDFPATVANTLVQVAQQQPPGLGVLTFEPEYITGDNGTLTPGGTYYVDAVFKTDGKSFNTTSIDALAATLDTAAASFKTVTDGLNLLSQPASLDAVRLGSSPGLDRNASTLETTGDLINSIKRQLLDANGNTSDLLKNDRLTAVFSHARKDNHLKATLFLHILSKISRSYTSNVPFFGSNTSGDNTVLGDYLVGQVNDALLASVPETTTALQFVTSPGLDNYNNNNGFTPTAISHAMKSGSKLMNVVVQLMSHVVSQFRTDNTALVGGFTRYNGYIDTSMMMVAFDLITSFIALYSSTQIVGFQGGQTSFGTGLTTFVVSQSPTNHRNSINNLLERVSGEVTRVQQMIMTVLHSLKVLSGSLKGISGYLKSEPAVFRLQQVAGVLNDPKLLQMLLTEQQIMLLASDVQNLVDASQPGLNAFARPSMPDPNSTQEMQILDESLVPPALQDALFGYFGTADFSGAQGSSNRVLTVGLPQGFVQGLQRSVSIQQQRKASFKNRRSDIVQVCVYKIDVVNSDIIYKPQRFLFDTARFPARLSTARWLPIPQAPAVEDIISAIPTIDLSQNPGVTTSTSTSPGVEYASATVAAAAGVKHARVAMSDGSYSFLTANQKAEILRNHVVSQLLDAYIKLMTGINVSEYTFAMADNAPPLEVDMLKKMIIPVARDGFPNLFGFLNGGQSQPFPLGGVMFGSTGLSSINSVPQDTGAPNPYQCDVSDATGLGGNVALPSQFNAISSFALPPVSLDGQQALLGTLDDNLNNIPLHVIPHVINHLRTFSTISTTLSTISQPAAVNQKVMTPKQFDRVFNIMVNPTDFEIDVPKTIATPYGKQALALMIKNGDIIPSSENEQALSQASDITARAVTPGSRPFPQGRRAGNVSSYRYRDRDVNAGDLIVDKYFITVETYGEGS